MTFILQVKNNWEQLLIYFAVLARATSKNNKMGKKNKIMQSKTTQAFYSSSFSLNWSHPSHSHSLNSCLSATHYTPLLYNQIFPHSSQCPAQLQVFSSSFLPLWTFLIQQKVSRSSCVWSLEALKVQCFWNLIPNPKPIFLAFICMFDLGYMSAKLMLSNCLVRSQLTLSSWCCRTWCLGYWHLYGFSSPGFLHSHWKFACINHTSYKDGKYTLSNSVPDFFNLFIWLN